MNTGFRIHPEQASTYAGEVDALYFYLCIVSAFFTLLIFCMVVYFSLRYRRRDDSIPPQYLGSVKLELLWSAIPLAFALSFFFWGARLIFKQYQPPDQALDVYVIGKQWMWKLQHPNGVREINSLHVPIGRPVRVTVSSQDVIHSFYIPAMRIKQDVVPGRYSKIWFQASKAGVYHLFCAEYCGTEHSRMIGTVTVMQPSDYEAWLAGRVGDVPPVTSGAELFRSFGCLTCHAAQAPTMAGLFGSTQQLADGSTVVADENYVRESILNSTAKIVSGYQPIMPSYRGNISEEQLSDLVAYIKSLRDARQERDAPPRAIGPEPGGLPPRRPMAPENLRPGPGPGGTP
jgi:cytochrome c oxidase subunit II